MVKSFPCSSIGTVPGPVMDLFSGEPGICDAKVGRSAEVKEASAVVVCGGVNEDRSSNWLQGGVEGVGSERCIKIGEYDGDVMRWGFLDNLQ